MKGANRASLPQKMKARLSPKCSSTLEALDKVGSDLQLTALGGGGATALAAIITEQPEFLEGAAKGAAAVYGLGSLIRNSVSAANFFGGNGNLSGLTLSEFNDAVIKNALPEGFLSNLADTALEKFESHEGLSQGDAPICPK